MINKVCLSGLLSIHLADLMIQSREAEIVLAGGMESMTGAPHLLPGARAGYRFGDAKLVDALIADGLFCAFDQLIMGESTDRYSRAATVSRARQDEIALNSHLRVSSAGNREFASSCRDRPSRGEQPRYYDRRSC